MPRPTQPPAKMRSLRVPDDPWDTAKDKSERDGVYLSEVVVAALHDYARGDYTPSGLRPVDTTVVPIRSKKTAASRKTAARKKTAAAKKTAARKKAPAKKTTRGRARAAGDAF